MDEVVSSHVRRLRALNPGPMTLSGTNTYLVQTAVGSVVVDPGPELPEHVAAIAANAGPIAAIVTTHHHRDHTGAVSELMARTGATTDLADLELTGEIEVIATPGHTHDSRCYLVHADRVLLSGDHVLGESTTVICPDGSLRDYLASLDLIAQRIRAGHIDLIAPGHGPVITDPAGWVHHLIQHRQERLRQIQELREAGLATTAELAVHLYPSLSAQVRPHALANIQAHLDYLDAAAATS